MVKHCRADRHWSIAEFYFFISDVTSGYWLPGGGRSECRDQTDSPYSGQCTRLPGPARPRFGTISVKNEAIFGLDIVAIVNSQQNITQTRPDQARNILANRFTALLLLTRSICRDGSCTSALYIVPVLRSEQDIPLSMCLSLFCSRAS